MIQNGAKVCLLQVTFSVNLGAKSVKMKVKGVKIGRWR